MDDAEWPGPSGAARTREAGLPPWLTPGSAVAWVTTHDKEFALQQKACAKSERMAPACAVWKCRQHGRTLAIEGGPHSAEKALIEKINEGATCKTPAV